MGVGDCVPLGSAYSRGEGGACVEAEAEGEDVECAAGECLDSDTGACATLGATYSLAMDGVTCAAAPTEPSSAFGFDSALAGSLAFLEKLEFALSQTEFIWECSDEI